jgi:hypothetical protein
VDFFVSHAGRDRAWAEWVAWHLTEAGYTVELDAWDWAAGENFVSRMHAAVDAAGRVVALLSVAYFEDGRYTAEELSSALVKDDDGAHRLVPVQVERCALPRLLRPLVRVELFDADEAEAVRRLLAAIRGPQRPDGAPLFPGRGSAGVLTGCGQAAPRLPGALPAVWNIGPRNPAFVGRDALLTSVHGRLRAGGAAAAQALHGLGGVGKTQVAIEYAHRYADSYELAWWVNAEEAGLVGDQLTALAAELGLVGPRTDTATAVSAVRAHLRGHGRWLLVFDNAGSPGDVRNWLPAGPGHILITSRNPGWGELAARVEVDVLPRPESAALLRAHRPDLADADTGRLADALGGLPLAIAQAGGFLAETGMPAGRYLDLLGSRVGELLDENPPEGHPLSLAAAVRLSADRLAQLDPAALALVRLGAFLAPEPIPADILVGAVPPKDAGGGAGPPEVDALVLAEASPVAVHRSLGRIGRFGLARIDGRGLQLHRLTQAILRDQLTAGQAAAYRDHAQALLAAADPGDHRDPAAWPAWMRLLPHLLAADPAASPRLDLRDLACRATWYLWYRGEHRPARELAVRLHRRWRDRLGPDDPHTLRAAHGLFGLLTDLGPYDQARQLGEDTLARSRRTLGDDHPDTLRAAHHLAVCLHELGEFEQARRLNADTLARRRRVFGDDHIDTWRSAHHLGRDLRALGDAEEARRLHEASVARGRRELGDDHPYTLMAIWDLGVTLCAAGEVEAARGIHGESLARARRVLGDDHFWTMVCARDLARDLRALGDLDAARRLGEEALGRARRVFGDDSRIALDIANDVAADLHARGEDDAARRLGEDTPARSRRVFGDDPPTLRVAATLRASTAGETGGPEIPEAAGENRTG